MGTPARVRDKFKKWKENSVDYGNRARQGINVVFEELIYKLLAPDPRQTLFQETQIQGGDPKRRNQRWRCSFHEERRHKTDSCRALKLFLDQLVRDGHLKEFVDEEKTRVEKTEAKPNSRFDRGDNDSQETADEEEDLPLVTIHMIGGPHYPDLENRIQGEIQMIK
ncbi:hypothetical protein Acr_16g0000160 [Actinidia rufa]|uniref:Uncharacterized protein n=1 Tax=Actinidia rufa TaxID=165716 RepID=A0A7J0FXH2_9ERIC|nr:hypothetical protein Acr_16g0000160 [Actinidia rufa]